MKGLIIKASGETINISDFMGFPHIRGASKECARVLEVPILRSDVDGYYPKIDINLGDTIQLLEDEEDVFKGVIWERELTDNSVEMNILAYDKSIYLNKNEPAEQVYTNMTPEAVTSQILGDMGLQAGSLASGETDNYNGRGMKAYDLIMHSYTKSSKKNKKKYKLVAKGDEIHVFESGEKHPIVLEELNEAIPGKLLNVSYRESLDDLVNKVEVIEEKDKDKKEITEENTQSQNQHGVITKLIKGDEADIAGQMKDVKREIDVECIGDFDMITGKSIYIKSPIIEGEFYITSDEHEITDATHIAKLTLSTEFEMDEREEGQTENSDEKSDENVSADVSGMLSAGKSKLGSPYVWGAAGPNAFDCSGFISWTAIQNGLMPNGARITSGNMSSSYVHKVGWNDLQVGDILHFSGNPGHVAFYAGNGKTLESTGSQGVVMNNFNPNNRGKYKNVYRFNKVG